MWRFPSKMVWNCVKKRIPLFKKMYKNKMTTSSLMWPLGTVPLWSSDRQDRQTDISNVDQKLHSAARRPASAGSVCSELQRGTEMFLCSCSLHGWWEKEKKKAEWLTPFEKPVSLLWCLCWKKKKSTSTMRLIYKLVVTTHPAIPPRAMWLWPGIPPSRAGIEKQNIRYTDQDHWS